MKDEPSPEDPSAKLEALRADSWKNGFIDRVAELYTRRPDIISLLDYKELVGLHRKSVIDNATYLTHSKRIREGLAQDMFDRLDTHPPQPLTPDERDTDDWKPLGGLEE